jgi:hypothetical protein
MVQAALMTIECRKNDGSNWSGFYRTILKAPRAVVHEQTCEAWPTPALAHDWWQNTETGRLTAVPRRSEISDLLCRKIGRDLGIPNP